MEIWKDIPGYEGLYQVSNLGRVKSLVRKTNNQHCRKEIILSYSNRNGYLGAVLYKDGYKKNCAIHRLVAMCFVPKNNASDNIINHIDGNKHNNKWDNLEWCSQKENVKHAVNHNLIDVVSLRKRSLIAASRRAKPIVQIKDGNIIAHWDSAKDASKKLGYDSSCICKALKGKIKKIYGYEWRYE